MGRNRVKRTSTDRNSDMTWSGLLPFREVALISSVALSLFVFLSLFSYHYTDPAWSNVSSTHQVSNLAGVVGAYVADVLFYSLGYVAYLLPFLFSYLGYLFYVKRYEPYFTSSLGAVYFFMKVLALFTMIVSLASLFTLLISIPSHRLPLQYSGGMVGYFMGYFLHSKLNQAGAVLVLLPLCLVSSASYFGASWADMLAELRLKLSYLAPKIFPVLRVRACFYSFMNAARRCRMAFVNGFLRNVSALLSRFRVASKRDAVPVAGTQLVASPDAHLLDGTTCSDNESVKKIKVPRYSRSKAMPKLSLLDAYEKETQVSSAKDSSRSSDVEKCLADFGVKVTVTAVHPGPVVTRYELQLAAGTKAAKITGLAKDLARSLSVVSVRVVEVIPGKSVVGIELPNVKRAMVSLKGVLASSSYERSRSSLSLALGKDIAGHPVVVDLAKMPHLLVAGTTGSGKSVALNTMLLSLLYKSTPEQLRLILIDPKMLELSIYDGIPHLLTPVVTDMKNAASALRWCVAEMERRYRLMASLGVRNVAGYNEKVRMSIKRGAPLLDPLAEDDAKELQILPQIVIIADEFADMMIVVGKKVETLIARLAQKARAAGVHLILATQRPSVDVITGLIKANIPTRIAFQVSSKVDSRTVLDQQGAEQLLGHGDMLYLPPGSGVPVRVHGAFVNDDEVHRVVHYLRNQSQPDYVEDILDERVSVDPSGFVTAAMGDTDGEQDEYYDEAVAFIAKARRVSVSSIQRRFKIGYNRAATIVETMETAGVVSKPERNGVREVLVPPPVEA